MNADKRAAAKHGPRIEPLTRLATGGMADIWLARELGAAGLERFVVIKRLLPHLARQPEIVDMFVSEARFVARLVHPNVVQIHELGEDEEGYFLVMEYVAGCSVRELSGAAAREGRPLPAAVAVSIVEQACRGAHAAHELTDPTGEPLGLVHRDISPHNLMIAPSGDVKLLDFGIAKATAAAEATRTGTLKGKHGYMSPEQCRANRVDRRSDVFALGIVCWELLTGERLFKRDTEFATMEAIVRADFIPPSEVRSDLPAGFDPVLEKALALDPAARWQTADAFRRALTTAADDAGMRPSRDELAATMVELLGPRLDERARALRAAAASRGAPDPAALREALMHSETSLDRHTQSSLATVVQRRSTHPPSAEGSAAPSATDPDEPTSTRTLSRGDPADDEATLVDKRRSEPPPEVEPSPDGEASPADPAAEIDAAAAAEIDPPAEADVELAAAAPEADPSPEPARPRPRWLLLAAVGVAAAAAIAVWALPEPITGPKPATSEAPPEPAPPSGPPLRFVVAPTVKPDVIRRELAPFQRWLGQRLDRPIELIIADSYRDTGERVISGRAHFGLLPPLLFVQTLAHEPRIQPLAVRLFDGSRASDGYLLVREDTPLTKASDLRGRTICHVDRTSTTGFLLPRIWLAKAGIDPDQDVRVHISGDHLAAMRDLAAEKCDAASVYSGAYLSARTEGIPVGQLRLLAITGRVPQDTLVATPELPEGEVKRLREALLAFEPLRDIDAGGLGEVLAISGFAAFDPADFDTIREAAAREGLLGEPEGGDL